MLLVLLNGLSGGMVLQKTSDIVAVAFPAATPSPTPTPTPPPTPEHHASAARNAPAPEAKKAEAAPVFAVRTILPPTIPTAPQPGSGSAARAGAGDTGNGSGAGGAGNGTGGGGDGDGGGSDPEWIGGKIKQSDLPQGARLRGAQGTVETEVAVSAEGRPTGCRVTHGSGDRDLDETTCRLVLQRFRFRPATDATGRQIAAEVDYDQEWIRTGPRPDGQD
ncbi:energy transducer TonB [Novosphingobium lentum]|uniref:energy transducer TonB n=1 Tax=Novosphingobium lentum TaxID=145287 RepID=UPI0012ED9AEB|nr:energy transducer TonB [Novosphingobium lentum]